MKKLLQIAGFLTVASLSAQITEPEITIYNYSPMLFLKRNTDIGGYVQGIQSRLQDNTDNWFTGNIGTELWAVGKGDYQNRKLTITSDGNVAIGTSAYPQYRLQVNDGMITSKIADATISPANKVGYLINQLGGDIFELSFARDNLGLLNMKTLVDNPIVIGTNNTERMRIAANGNIGIGTSAPAAKLHVYQEPNSQPIDAMTIDVGSFGNPTNADNSHFFRVRDIGAGGNIPFIIKGNGNVGIGSANPDAKLAVRGLIHANEVKVDLNVPADYVFQKYYTGTSALKPEYTIPTLEDVEKFTKENNHLPNIPSAKEIQEKGLNVGEMSNLLLQKIEELTLYTIEQNKLIKEQQKRIEALENKTK
ncbi:hypothetical protein GCM10022217_31930 [Chryseobacterium ginsenosidimutans]|uniref:hypothetical protein n=1 Tax=Chryseobacterium ginsenosidimutans TaxID=687846 RepID=UPI0031D73062